MPISQHQVTSTNNPAATANVGYPRLASGTHSAEASEQHIPAPKANNQPSSARAINAKSTKTSPTRANPNSSPEKANSHPKRSPKQSRTTPGPKPTAAFASGTIQALLNKNAAYQPIANEATAPAADDDVVVVNETNLNPSSIEHILCRSEQSRDLLQACKEIIAGWPNSFAHADNDFFAKLATCYLIQFPSFMCYAVTALRILTHAPWSDSMFHGHIRELVLCAIGNGWTWVDQTASIHKRRVSPGEVCAALASYMNQTAFPPGQISDLDTAAIAVCDDLFPDHCELFFSQFSVRCLSCGAEGQVSVPLFDATLIVNGDGTTVDLDQMLSCRLPRLALDREDVAFSHAHECPNYDQLIHEEISGCLLFTLKITSPSEQLPPASRMLNKLGRSFYIPSLSEDPVTQTFVLTGIIIVQGGPSHHFLLIERFHQGKILLYDNLKGHKWIPSSQLESKSLVWGFVFRRQDQQQYSFQPKQYKAIAPCALADTKPPKPPKEAKAPKSRPNPALGINAKKYHFPIKPSKPKEASDAGVPTSHLNVDESNQGQNTAQANARTPDESANQPCLSLQKITGGNESHHHGIPMAGPLTTNNVHCPSTQQELGPDNRSGQHGIPMAGFPGTNPQYCPPTQQELAHTQDACNQHEIPKYPLMTSTQPTDSNASRHSTHIPAMKEKVANMRYPWMAPRRLTLNR